MRPGETLDFTLVFTRDEENGFAAAECLELPGCSAQGHAEFEAKADVMSAIEACVPVMLEDAITSAGAGHETRAVEGQHQRVSLPGAGGTWLS